MTIVFTNTNTLTTEHVTATNDVKWESVNDVFSIVKSPFCSGGGGEL